jgi:hypothetical protein
MGFGPEHDLSALAHGALAEAGLVQAGAQERMKAISQNALCKRLWQCPRETSAGA